MCLCLAVVKSNLSAAVRKKIGILFEGDSITDAQRNRKNVNDNGNEHGVGYPSLITSLLSYLNPMVQIQVTNRALAGSTIFDVIHPGRLAAQVSHYKPSVLSFYAGVNDVWFEVLHNATIAWDVLEKEMR